VLHAFGAGHDLAGDGMARDDGGDGAGEICGLVGGDDGGCGEAEGDGSWGGVG
jgi:hypothetical protein